MAERTGAPGQRPVLALLGPTAAGKSAAAIQAAERLAADGVEVEIVAVDAFTVYRGMDVGTAKPPAEVRQRLPHHLVDVLEPEDVCTVAWFQTSAREAISAIRGRGAVPLLVGGSGLYWRAVVDGLEFPPTDPQVRAAIEARVGGDARRAHAELADLDPAAAARIDPDNLRRSVRALEVLELTGRPFSDWRSVWDRHDGVVGPLHVVGLLGPRDERDVRIQERVDAMVAAGLVEECEVLRRRALSVTARQAIGYAEVFDALEGRLDLGTALDLTVRRTRRYAARQLRWFRADPRVGWQPSSTAAVDELVAAGTIGRSHPPS